MGKGELRKIYTNDTLVSVIMSVYHTPVSYLRDAIDSILNQDYSNIQFIIINDGDRTQDIIECLNGYLCDDRVTVLENGVNIGLTKSLNVALEHCSGQYVARMDSDDISMPDRIRTQVDYMENHPDICMTGTDTLVFSDKDPSGRKTKRSHLSDQRVREIRLLFENTGYPHPTFMLRKSFLDEHGIRYREDIPKAQDYALTTDCILAGGKRHLIDKPLLKYRIHDGQVSNKGYLEQVECQAITAYRRLRAAFESLSDDECWAIARLNHERQDYTASVIIRAIKKIFNENRDRGLFDKRLLEREFFYEYYRKVMRISRINKKPWGMMTMFFLRAIPHVVSVKVEDRVGYNR